MLRNITKLTLLSLSLLFYAFYAGPARSVAAPQTATAPQTQDGTFKTEEIAQLVAPVALYPDALLAQVLMASTYPFEVAQAAQYVKKNENLKGQQLVDAVEKQSWDQSVKALTQFPPTLQMMSDHLDWMQKLGDAFLAQQKAVMNEIQVLRKKALDAGFLKNTDQQRIITSEAEQPQPVRASSERRASPFPPQEQIAPAPVEQTLLVQPLVYQGAALDQFAIVPVQQEVVVSDTSQTIVIEPTDPNEIYVPTYDPGVVYGSWPYPSYPPPYYPYAGYGLAAAGVGFIAGAALGNYWNNPHVDWSGGNINIDNNFNRNANFNRNNNINRNNIGNNNGNRWQHNPEHRRGTNYRDTATRERFGKGNAAAADARRNFRGFDGRGQGNGLQNRPGGGDRVAQGRRAQTRPATNRANQARQGGRGQNATAGNRAGGNRTAANRGSANRGNQARRGGGQNFATNRAAGNRANQVRPNNRAQNNFANNRGTSFAERRGGGGSFNGVGQGAQARLDSNRGFNSRNSSFQNNRVAQNRSFGGSRGGGYSGARSGGSGFRGGGGGGARGGGGRGGGRR